MIILHDNYEELTRKYVEKRYLSQIKIGKMPCLF